MATNPLNRWPSTKTGQIRSAPPAAKNDAKPANGIAVEGPEPNPVCVGRYIGVQQPDQREGYDDPAVGTILPLAGAQVPVTEERYAGQHEERDRKGNQGRVREEGGKSAPAKDGEPEIGKGRH